MPQYAPCFSWHCWTDMMASASTAPVKTIILASVFRPIPDAPKRIAPLQGCATAIDATLVPGSADT